MFGFLKAKKQSLYATLNQAYRRVGIGNYENDEVSGEEFLIKVFLKDYFSSLGGRGKIVFDVGANVGNFSKKILGTFPDCRIHAFEPGRGTFLRLVEAFPGGAVCCEAFALGANEETVMFFDDPEHAASEHATAQKGVMELLHNRRDVQQYEVKMTTIDRYCSQKQIPGIDFLKIDVEGLEHDVLAGACGMLVAKKIPLIQFEFNEMNVVSRKFMRDFYDLLKGYSIHRLASNGLLPLGEYSSYHEIFHFQNIVAISDDVKERFHFPKYHIYYI